MLRAFSIVLRPFLLTRSGVDSFFTMNLQIKLQLVALGAVFALCGFYFPDIAAFYFGGFHPSRETEYRRSMDWPVAAGVVTKSATEHRACFPWENADFGQISYAYTVGGRSYSCSNIRSGYLIASLKGPLPDFDRSPGYVNLRYPVGKHVVVHYNPKNPQAAYLEAAISDSQLLIGHGIGIFGAIILFVLACDIIFKSGPSNRYNPLIEPRQPRDTSTTSGW